MRDKVHPTNPSSLAAFHDAALYAPMTIFVDEREDGVHLSYDPMASYLAAYGKAVASEVARNLDSEVEALLRQAAN